MASPDRAVEERLRATRQQIETLKQRIAAVRQSKEEEAMIGWETWGKESSVLFNFNIRRSLRGHFGKICAIDWAGDNTTLLSASQDGKLIVWNAFTENKKDAINLKSAWVMACAFEKEEQRYVASGGLDNTCTAFDLRNPVVPAFELIGHEGYLADCKWIGESHILTCSGDGTCVVWDTERGVRQHTFDDHTADVMSVATHPTEPHIFVSGSCDTTVKLWDIRAGVCVRTFTGHVSDVNAVEFFPSGMIVGSGSDDASCRMFDLRACGPVNVFTEDRIACSVTDVCFSKSGRLMFASYEDNFCIAWETISKEGTFHELKGHKNRVSCIGVNASGQALCTGSWDMDIAIWS